MAERFYEKTWPGAGDLSLHSDIQSDINLANNAVYHDRTKIIHVRNHFICILLKDGVLSLVKI